MDLSVLIPARNERWLARTVADVLEHAKADTEVIVVLDGAWPESGYELPQHPRVQVIYLPESIGQRAATNLAARVSTARYVMKLDGHCSLADGFDAELIRTGDELGPNVTQIPAQKNLHVYDRICPCGRREYQGSPSAPCVTCGKTEWALDIQWRPRRGVHTTSWVFDSDLHFQYDKTGQRQQQGDICDVMSSLGACLFVNRQHFLDLGGFDEAYGSWGQYGQEWACKEWLSGGRHVTNKRTWFAHFFRVGGIGFPYEIKSSEQEHARQYARNLWRANAWPGQVKPLLWLVDKFWPVPGWTEEQRDALPIELPSHSASAFSGVLTDDASTRGSLAVEEVRNGGQQVPVLAVGLNAAPVGVIGSVGGVDNGQGQPQVGGITAPTIPAQVVELMDVWPLPGRDGTDKPCVHQSVNLVADAANTDLSVAATSRTSPVPASVVGDVDGRKYASDQFAVETGYFDSSHTPALSADVGLGADVALQRDAAPSILSNPPTKSVVYYSDCRVDREIDMSCRASIERSGLPVVAVTLKPIDWPYATNVVVPIERGYAAMFKQILIGLTVAQSDVVFLAEHDVLYDISHFAFVPPRDDYYYYNLHWWKVDAATGLAVTYDAKQTSQLCANRQLLLEHYRQRVARVEREGFSRAMGFEPGSHRRKERVDDVSSDVWRSPVANVDIRHGHNLTPSRWRQDQFRDQRHCQSWQEAETVPGWDLSWLVREQACA